MDSEWICLALRDPGFRNSILLKASRHLSTLHQQGRQRQVLFNTLATQYKLVCVQSLGKTILSGSSPSTQSRSFSDSAVAQTLELAQDEMVLGDLAMSRKHVQGGLRMAELNGGTHTLGMNCFLETVLFKSVGEVGLLSHPVEVPGSSVNLFMSIP